MITVGLQLLLCTVFTLISEVMKIDRQCQTVQDLAAVGQRGATVAERQNDAAEDLSTRHISRNGKHVNG